MNRHLPCGFPGIGTGRMTWERWKDDLGPEGISLGANTLDLDEPLAVNIEEGGATSSVGR